MSDDEHEFQLPPTTHCPCCMSGTCHGREVYAQVAGVAAGREESLNIYRAQLRIANSEAARWRRAFERNRIVIEMLAKYPEEDEHGR